MSNSLRDAARALLEAVEPLLPPRMPQAHPKSVSHVLRRHLDALRAALSRPAPRPDEGPVRWIACPNGDYLSEESREFDDAKAARIYAEDKNAEQPEDEEWGVVPLYLAPPAPEASAEAVREACRRAAEYVVSRTTMFRLNAKSVIAEAVRVAMLPVPSGEASEVERARDECIAACRNTALSFNNAPAGCIVNPSDALAWALNAGNALLRAEADAKGGDRG